MQTYTLNNALAQLASLEGGAGVSEYHLMIQATDREATFKTQLKAVTDGYEQLRREQLAGAVAVMKRYFLSDAANQADRVQALAAEGAECALSVVEQPPLGGTKVALWVYLQTDMQSRMLPGGLFEAKHGAYRHLWGGGACNRAANSEYQTRLLLGEYVMQLAQQGCRLADHCLRTWLFVQNVDVNYAGVVKARNELFVTQGLTPQTHFIASTGIGGRHADPKVTVQLDTYAVAGLLPQQIRYLYAREWMNPTYEYGVSFERGTAVEYGDRRHVFISGTASINNKGEVLHPGDIRLQTRRMWQNVEALLQEAGCGYDDVQQMLVYLRDGADYLVVKRLFDEWFPHTPKLFVQAPVCRPAWLVEMECMAIKRVEQPAYAPL